MAIKKLNSIFHKHSRVLLLGLAVLVIIPFILGDVNPGGCNDSSNTEIGVAYGEKVSVSDLRKFAQTLMLTNPSRNDDWQQLFNQYCYVKRAEQMGLVVSDDEVAEELRKSFRTEGTFSKEKYDKFLKDNGLTEEYLKLMVRTQLGEKTPGREITDKEVQAAIEKKSMFLTEGTFSAERFNKFLKERNLSKEDFLESLRLNLLLRKLQNTLVAGIVVTDAEAECFYRMANPGFELSYCFFPAEKFVVDDPKEEDLKKYYDDIKKANPNYPAYDEVKKDLPDTYKKSKQLEKARKFAEGQVAKLNKLKGDAQKKAFAELKFTHGKMTVPMQQADLMKMTSDRTAMMIYQHFNCNLPEILSALPQMEKMMESLEIMPRLQQYSFYTQYSAMTNMLNNLFLAGLPEVMSLTSGELSPVLNLDNGVALVLVEKRLDADMKDFAKCKDILIKQLRDAKSQMTLQEFHENTMRQCTYTPPQAAAADPAAETPAK